MPGQYVPVTVYKVNATTHAFTTIATFDGTNGILGPGGCLIIDKNDNLYGTSNGQVFQIAAGTHAVSMLASFNGTDGTTPGNLVLDARGNLFGTTSDGGPNGGGTVFEISSGSHAITTLTTFSGSNVSPGGLILDAHGNIYGETYMGGTGGDGTVFELSLVPEPDGLVLAAIGVSVLLAAAYRRNCITVRPHRSWRGG